jgi:hypothetical protein
MILNFAKIIRDVSGELGNVSLALTAFSFYIKEP